MAKIFAPAAESAAIKQVTAPAAATSNAAPAAEQKEPQTNPTSRRRAPSAPIWSALTVVFVAERTYGDPKRASYDIKNEARKLTNLMDFGEYCRKNGLKGENVAEHVVFEGKTVMRRVMEYGVESVLGTKIQMFAEPLTDGKEKSTESEANAE